VRLTIFVTSIDEFQASAGAVGGRLAAAGIRQASTLLEVNRLAFPELMCELEATAVK
jgi:enamine deaminase RidA (YjgF/YER057c/UK114 family)